VAALRAARWRLAGRVGRFLVGGQLAEIERRLWAANETEAQLQKSLADVGRSLASLGGSLGTLRTELADTRRALDARDAERAAYADARAADFHHRLDAISGRLSGVGAQVGGLERAVTTAKEIAARHSDSLRWLAERHTTAALDAPSDGALVTVVMPTWNRAATIVAAVESVRAQTYPNWELVIVDDGSTDGTATVVKPLLADGRIRYLTADHGGCCRARNLGLAKSRGALVAYLDSDNTFDPGYLAAVQDAFARHPDHDAAYFGQLVFDRVNDSAFIRAEPFDRARLEHGNFVDVNVFAHRRSLYERFGGFDESLSRLSDWDLVIRYTAEKDPLLVDAIGGRYELGRRDQISMVESYFRDFYFVRRKGEPRLEQPLRVLYALFHYPQLSESYVRTEIRCLRRWGVEVQVWAEEPGAAPFEAEVPVHHGRLADAIARVAPDVIHMHWLNTVAVHHEALARAGVPVTVRGHGFDFSPATVAALEKDPLVAAIFLFPHFAAVCPDATKVRAMPPCFDADLYGPGEKDRRLVVRAAAALPTKDLPAFIRIAARCPQHRFVLAVCHASRHEGYVDELVAYNRALGEPADIRVDLQHEEIAALVREAGIALHTHGLLEPYGMPMSIAEALATGAWVVARRCPPAESYLGPCGRFYDHETEAAAAIRETLAWSDERWLRERLAAVDHAYAYLTDSRMLRALLDEWLRIAAARADRRQRDAV
jgi:glycosyltransferase involved in cell wall biosynthesis